MEKSEKNDHVHDNACDCDGGGDDSPKSPRRRKGYIPYGTVYESQDELRKQGYWIPGISVDAKIVAVEKDTSSQYHILNPFLYTIQLEHGKYKWHVVRRYKDFSYLSQRLMAHRAVERIKSPIRRVKTRLEEAIDRDDDSLKDKDSSKLPASSNYQLRMLKKATEIGDYGRAGAGRTSTYDNYDEDDDIEHIDGNQPEEKREPSDDPIALPSFPMRPDSLVQPVHMEERRHQLETWLHAVLAIPINRDYHETAEFLEVSRFSFINELGGKYKEGKVKKRPGGNKVYIGCKQFCVRWILPWFVLILKLKKYSRKLFRGKRWLMVKDSYICYMNLSSEQIRLVLFFDEQFEINSPEFGLTFRPKELFLSNMSHVLNIKCSREEDSQYWIKIIKRVIEETGQVWLRKKPFGSSYPPRMDSFCQWFVDAKEYWDKASAMIEMAREEIFIADWWLCPEIYMRRPMAEGNHWRLDYVLKRQAEKGVRIFILIYKEMEMAIGLNSLYSKRHLQNLHPNIKVMRHPDHYVGTGTFFWAHHEKLLIIDQLIAFVGGLDLCYGRWDDSRHVLTDLGSVKLSPRSEQFTVENTGKDGNPIMHSIKHATDKCHLDVNKSGFNEKQEVHRVTEDIIEKGEKIGTKVTTTIQAIPEDEEDAQAPKRNLREAMHKVMGRIKGGRSRETTPASESLNTHPLYGQGGSDAVEAMERTSEGGKPMIKFRSLTAIGEQYPDGTTHNGLHMKPTLLPMEPSTRTLMRRVVSNLRPSKTKRRWRMALDQEDTAEEYVINYCRFQETTVDMSGLQGAGKLWPGKDYVNYIVKDFVDVHEAYNDFINRYDTPRMPWHDIHSIVYGSAARDVARHFIQRWNATKTEKLKSNDDYPYLLPKSYNSVKIPRVFLNRDTQKVEVQVLRSVSHWSTLIDKNEDSIQQAYLSLIANARHYIYIENQFFVSMIKSVDVTNEIAQVLCDRIVKAHKNDETFRVFVMIPLLPGFEGDISSTSYSALLAVLHWTLLSISKGPHSLLENLRKNGVEDPSKYISFCSLRTHDELVGKIVTELIYIHSKLLIVDDLYTIIGSGSLDQIAVFEKDMKPAYRMVITMEKFNCRKGYQPTVFSANINDRSQAGNRDSEVCLLIKDHEFVPSTMNGEPYEAGKFAYSLRKRLMEEHLGLMEDSHHKADPGYKISVEDPIVDAFYNDIWREVANENTRIFEEVFRCYPTNLVETFQELTVWRGEIPMSQSEPDEARQKLKGLVGNLVNFPMDFLKQENLSPTIASKEGLVPSAVFT